MLNKLASVVVVAVVVSDILYVTSHMGNSWCGDDNHVTSDGNIGVSEYCNECK